MHITFTCHSIPNFQVQEDSAPGTVFYTLRAADPDVNGTDGLHFAAAEPITAVDKNGKQINNTEEFKVYKYLQINTFLWRCGLTI